MHPSERTRVLDEWERQASRDREQLHHSRQEAMQMVAVVDVWFEENVPQLQQQLLQMFEGRLSARGALKLLADVAVRHAELP